MKVKEEKQLENGWEVRVLQREFKAICRIPEEITVRSEQRSQSLSTIPASQETCIQSMIKTNSLCFGSESDWRLEGSCIAFPCDPVPLLAGLQSRTSTDSPKESIIIGNFVGPSLCGKDVADQSFSQKLEKGCGALIRAEEHGAHWVTGAGPLHLLGFRFREEALN